MSTLQEDLDALDALLAELNKVLDRKMGKRSRPATNNPGRDPFESSAYNSDDGSDSDYEDMDPEDDEDSDEEPDSIDPDNMDSGELDASNSDDDQDPELSLTNNRRRMGKRYGQVDSATTGTKFEQRVAYVKARDGCSASEAASRARKENPILYESYLKSGLAKGSNTYWAKVQERMLLGDSQTVAEQKVLHAFGKTLATPDINKSADVVDFMRITDSIMKQHPGLSRVEAMRKARLRNPRAFGRYQNVR